MDLSERERLERRLALARRKALEAQLALARQKAISGQIRHSPHEAEVADRLLLSLQAVQTAADQDFRGLLARWRTVDGTARTRDRDSVASP
jgi:hypothetical protein